MTGDNKHIDQLFRDGLKGMRSKAPVHSWKRLDEALDGAIYRKKMFYIKLAAASVLIVMAFGAGFFYASVLNKPADIVEKEVIDGEAAPSFQPGNKLTQPSIKDIDEPASQESDKIHKDLPSFAEETTGNQGTHENLVGENQATPTDVQLAMLPLNEEKQNGRMQTTDNISMLAFIPAKEINTVENSAAVAGISKTESAMTYDGYASLFPLENYDDSPKQKVKQWTVGAQFAPTKSYRDISVNYNSNTSINQGLEDNLNDTEDALLSYAGGVNVDYNFSGKWSVQSGMYFSRIGQVNNNALQFTQNNKEILLFAITTSTGDINIAFERVPDHIRSPGSVKDTIDMGGATNVKVVQNFDLFEVPLVLKYKFLDKRLSMNLSGGLSPAYLVDNNTYLEMEDHKYDVGSSENLNSMVMNTTFGLGIEYLFTKKLSVSFEPTFKYSLNPLNNNSDFSYHPYYFSWFTGIKLKIN